MAGFHAPTTLLCAVDLAKRSYICTPFMPSYPVSTVQPPRPGALRLKKLGPEGNATFGEPFRFIVTGGLAEGSPPVVPVFLLEQLNTTEAYFLDTPDCPLPPGKYLPRPGKAVQHL